MVQSPVQSKYYNPIPNKSFKPLHDNVEIISQSTNLHTAECHAALVS